MLWELIFPFGLWAGGGPRGGARGPKGTFNMLRLVGRKLLSNIIAAVVAFLAAVIGFLAAVIGLLGTVMGTHILGALGTHIFWCLGTHILWALGTHMLWALGTHFPFRL